VSRPHLADMKRAMRRLETVAELTTRLDKLEAAIAAMAARLQRLEGGARDQREAEFDVTSMIG
jgi:septal ring factor EnvC (AmiA/AmiB activator)